MNKRMLPPDPFPFVREFSQDEESSEAGRVRTLTLMVLKSLIGDVVRKEDPIKEGINIPEVIFGICEELISFLYKAADKQGKEAREVFMEQLVLFTLSLARWRE